jgi:hypothetical protein
MRSQLGHANVSDTPRQSRKLGISLTNSADAFMLCDAADEPFEGIDVGFITTPTFADSDGDALTYAITYEDAVVFALAPSLNKFDSAATRFRNISATGAEKKLQEPKLHVGFIRNTMGHVDESVALAVLE